jgi:hypothetical protein
MSVLNNNGISYTLYYNILNYFKTILTNHPSVGFVSQGDIWELDTASFPKYPIANIMITTVGFRDNLSVYRCGLIVADKPKAKERASEGEYNKQNIDFWGDDDTVDIHANTLGIITDIIAFTKSGTTNFDIVGDVNCTPFKDKVDNGLVGWGCEFTVTTFNDNDKCLFNLLDESELTDC